MSYGTKNLLSQKTCYFMIFVKHLFEPFLENGLNDFHSHMKPIWCIKRVHFYELGTLVSDYILKRFFSQQTI